MTGEKEKNELEVLKDAMTRFYNSKAGKHELNWLDEFEKRMLKAAITTSDPTARLGFLDQAKGLRVFRESYLDTLIRRD